MMEEEDEDDDHNSPELIRVIISKYINPFFFFLLCAANKLKIYKLVKCYFEGSLYNVVERFIDPKCWSYL